MAENVGGIVWTAEMKTELLISAQKIVESSMASTGAAFEKAAKKSEQTSNSIASDQKKIAESAKSSAAIATKAQMRLSKTADAVKGSLGGLRGQASNIGFQLQDAAVQLQAGTANSIIVGQQLSQLLGGFGALGAAAGALVAIGAAAYTMSGAFDNAAPAADRLKKSLEGVDGVTIQTENSVSVLTKEIEALYAVSKEAALAQIITGLVSAKNATKEAGEAIREEFSKADGSFGPLGHSIDDAIAKFDSITQRTKDFGTISRREISEQSEAYQSFGERLGAVGGEAEALGFNIVSALSQLKKTGDVQAFQAAFAGLVNQYGASNEKLATFSAKLTELFSKARTAAEATKFLEQAQSDLAGTLQRSGESTEPVIRSLTQQLEIQKTALKDGATAAELLAAAFSLGKTSIEQLPAPIRALITEINKLKNNTIITELEMQEAQLRMTGNEYELYAAKQSAALSGATPEQTAAIEARIKSLQDLRLGLEAVSDQEAEDEQKRQSAINREQSIKDLEREIQLAGIKNQLGNEEYELRAAILALGKDATQPEVDRITNLITQMQALRFEAELLGPAMQDSFNDVTLGALDQFSSGLARVITEGDSAREMFGNLAKTIATELLTAIIRYWVGQAAAAIVGQTAVAGATVAAGAAAATAWTPAAILANTATLGGASAVGLTALGGSLAAGAGLVAATQTGSALTAGAGRKNGGPVNAGMIYPVSEGGDPELLMQGGRSYLLPGSGGGNVVSAKDMQVSGGGSNAPIINITNYSGSQASVQGQRFSDQDKRWVLDVVVGDMNKRGQTHKAVTNTTNAVNRTS